MSIERFRRAISVMNLRQQDLDWWPKWILGYQRFAPVAAQHHGELIPVSLDLVIGFLRSLRDSRIPAWRRLQAARAIEVYQGTVLKNSLVDFRPIRDKLREIEAKEKHLGGEVLVSGNGDQDLVPGEGNEGVLDPSESEAVRRMRKHFEHPSHA